MTSNKWTIESRYIAICIVDHDIDEETINYYYFMKAEEVRVFNLVQPIKRRGMLCEPHKDGCVLIHLPKDV